MHKAYLCLIASMLVTFVLGSVHAFSVFILPLEAQLALPRAQISLIYSFALVFITTSVLFGYLFYARLSAWVLIMLTCGLAALGIIVAARAETWWGLFFGYSLLFGGSNGLGYGYTLQLVGRVLPTMRGFAMGAVTAAYALGSIVFARVIAWQVEQYSLAQGFVVLALAIMACGLFAGALLWFSQARYKADGIGSAAQSRHLPRRSIALLWCAYLLNVFAGLMAIGHAAGIAAALGAALSATVWSAVSIGIGSALGGFIAGWLVDRYSSRSLLIGLPLLSALVLISLSLQGDQDLVIALLTLVGFAYGSSIAIYPVVIANRFGASSARVYGLVFTAWGLSGLLAPWSAGLIYDASASYSLALIVAALAALGSALTVWLGKIE